MKRFISGAEIRERHQWLPFEFMAVMESRELVPIDPEAEELVRLTEDVNPCLYCNGDLNAQECGRGEVIFACDNGAGGFATVRVCQRQISNATRSQELDAAIFFFSEVLDYEKAHGLKSDDAPPENSVPVQAASAVREEVKEQSSITLPTIPGTAWDQIRIRIAKNDRFEIERPGYKMEFYNAQDLGLKKAKAKQLLLKAFGFSNGELGRGIIKEASAANMSNLRKQISLIFPQVKGDPIPINEDGKYVCQFQISMNKEEFSREHYTRDEAEDEMGDWEEIMGIRK